MIKVIASDMDGTLFYGHGETVFDLTERNQQALQLVKHSGIRFHVASGRMISYGKYILNQSHLTDQIIAGFNGAVIYDNGLIPVAHSLSIQQVQKIISYVPSSFFKDGYLQIQTFNNERLFDRPNHHEIETYAKEAGVPGICKIFYDKTIYDYLHGSLDITVGKLSIVSKYQEQAQPLFRIIKSAAEPDCFVTMSNPKCIEVMNPKANKGTFIQYLMDTYHYKKEEIAVIGDSLNDMDMYPFSTNRFAMANGIDELKAQADYIVQDVAECIETCIKFNQQ